MDPGDGRGILQRPALDIAAQAVDDPRIPKCVAAVLLLRESSRLRLGPGVRTAIRKSSCAGLVRVEHRRTRSRQRTVAGKAGLHQERAAGLLRPRRRQSHADRRLSTQGLVTGLPRCRDVQTRLLVWVILRGSAMCGSVNLLSLCSSEADAGMLSAATGVAQVGSRWFIF